MVSKKRWDTEWGGGDSRDGQPGCFISVLSGYFSSLTFRFQFKASAKDSFVIILSEQCTNVCYHFPETYHSVKTFPLYFVFFLLGGGHKSEIAGAENLKDELSVWAGLLRATSILRYRSSAIFNLEWKWIIETSKLFLLFRIKYINSKFVSKVWNK